MGNEGWREKGLVLHEVGGWEGFVGFWGAVFGSRGRGLGGEGRWSWVVAVDLRSIVSLLR